MLDIIREQIGEDAIFLKLAGKLIYDTEEDVTLTFEEITQMGRNVLLDVSELSYVNSSGLGIMINFLKNLRNNGRKLVLINPSVEVRMLFEITSLDKMFQIAKNLDEAKDLI